MDVDGYEYILIFTKDDQSFLAWHCLKRPSDCLHAVGFVERVPFEGEFEKPLMDVVTPLKELNFTTEDAALWTWWPTIQEAVRGSENTFAHTEDWSIKSLRKVGA